MPPDSQREVESKFDVAPDFALPDLTSLVKRGGRVEVSTVELLSTYFDTEGLSLYRAHLTLRRRNGDADTGWHLKVPGEGFRTELRWPLTEDDSTPEELGVLIDPFLAKYASIAPIALVRVVRTRYRLLDSAGSLRVEVADDQVRSEGLAAQLPGRRWREIEAELGPAAGSKDAARVARLLLEAGAVASASRSKLGRAVYGQAPKPPQETAGADAVIAYFDRQVDAMISSHFALAQDHAPASPLICHQLGQAARRARDTLRTFEGVLPPQQVAALRTELGWVADELGAAHDCQELLSRLNSAIEELPGYLIIGPVADRITHLLSTEMDTHTVTASTILLSERYAALLRSLTEGRDQPTGRSAPRESTVRTAFDAAAGRMSRLVQTLAADGMAGADLIRTRRTAKRARHTAEAVLRAYGKPAAGLAKAASGVDAALAEYRDAVLATDALRRMADEAARFGEPSFTYGVLVGEQRRAATESGSAQSFMPFARRPIALRMSRSASRLARS